MNTFGDKIVEGRKRKGMSQEAFADLMGVSRQMVSRWELNTAMPRMQKIKKISEILEISIEDLLSGEEKAKSNPVAFLRVNIKSLLKVIAVILIILIVLYLLYFGYKMIIFNIISSKIEQYKNVNNYHFKMESLIDGALQSSKEVWYKDGYYKIIEKDTMNSMTNSGVTYLDLNSGYRYIVDDNTKTYNEIKLFRTEQYNNGIYMYKLFPTMIRKEATDFKEIALKLNFVLYTLKKESITLKINNEEIELNKNNFLPMAQNIKMHENKNTQLNINRYNIELDIVQDEDVKIPLDYAKLN